MDNDYTMHAGNSSALEVSAVSVCQPLLYTDSLNRDLQSMIDPSMIDQSAIDSLRAGDVRALARAISTVENRLPGWADLLKALFPHAGHAQVIGLTGARCDERSDGKPKAPRDCWRYRNGRRIRASLRA